MILLGSLRYTFTRTTNLTNIHHGTSTTLTLHHHTRNLSHLFMNVIRITRSNGFATSTGTNATSRNAIHRLTSLVNRGIRMFFGIEKITRRRDRNAPTTVGCRVPRVFINTLLRRLNGPNLVIRQTIRHHNRRRRHTTIVNTTRRATICHYLTRTHLRVLKNVFVANRCRQGSRHYTVHVNQINPTRPNVTNISLLISNLRLNNRTIRHRQLRRMTSSIMLSNLLNVLRVIRTTRGNGIRHETSLTRLPHRLSTQSRQRASINRRRIQLGPLSGLRHIRPITNVTRGIRTRHLPKSRYTSNLTRLILVIDRSSNMSIFIDRASFSFFEIHHRDRG